MKYTGEVHWNEWGRSWYPCYPERETAAEAGFICKTMAQVSQLADYFAYWCLSDIYDQVGYGREAFHGNYGMLSLQGLRKPSYHAHQLLAMLGDKSHPVACPDAPEGFGAVATSGDKRHVLVYAYHQPTDPVLRRTVSVALPAGAMAERIKLYPISSTENNILHQWREMGAPDYLSRDQTAHLRANNTLRPSIQPVELVGNAAMFTFESPGAAVLAIE
jgi:xylan 1,4-beta-xylosidase